MLPSLGLPAPFSADLLQDAQPPICTARRSTPKFQSTTFAQGTDMQMQVATTTVVHSSLTDVHREDQKLDPLSRNKKGWNPAPTKNMDSLTHRHLRFDLNGTPAFWCPLFKWFETRSNSFIERKLRTTPRTIAFQSRRIIPWLYLFFVRFFRLDTRKGLASRLLLCNPALGQFLVLIMPVFALFIRFRSTLTR